MPQIANIDQDRSGDIVMTICLARGKISVKYRLNLWLLNGSRANIRETNAQNMNNNDDDEYISQIEYDA